MTWGDILHWFPFPGYGETTMVGEFYLGMFHANNDYVAGNSKALLPEALKLATTTDPL